MRESLSRPPLTLHCPNARNKNLASNWKPKTHRRFNALTCGTGYSELGAPSVLSIDNL